MPTSVLHRDRGLSRLLEQFKDKPIIDAFIRTWLEEFDEIEDVLVELLLQKAIATAEGFQLDILGEILGRRRQGVLNDADYRTLLTIQIDINNSKGQAATILKVWNFLTGSTDSNLTEHFPAQIELFTNAGPPTAETLQAIGKVLAVTVAADFIFGNEPAFRFDGPSTGGGYSSVHSPSSGGRYVSRVRM